MKKLNIVLIGLLSMSINMIYSMDEADGPDATIYNKINFDFSSVNRGSTWNKKEYPFASNQDKLKSNSVYLQAVSKCMSFEENPSLIAKLDAGRHNLIGFSFEIKGKVMPDRQGSRFEAEIISNIREGGDLEKVKQGALDVSRNFKTLGVAKTTIIIVDSDGKNVIEPIVSE